MEGRKRNSPFSIRLIAAAIGLAAASLSAASVDTLMEPAPLGPTAVAAATPAPGSVASEANAGGHAGSIASPSKAESTPAVTPTNATAAPTVTQEAAIETPTTPTSPTTPKVAEPGVAAIEHTPIKPKENSDQTAGTKQDTPSSTTGMMSMLQVGGALAIVLGIIVIGRALMRRFMPGTAVGNGKGVMETLARYPIGRNQSVVLLRIGSQIVALNQTKEASQSILVISEPMEVAKIIGQVAGEDPKSIQANFNRALANARMDLENPGEESDETEVLQSSREEDADDDLDQQLEEMAAAKRQLMELRAQVRNVRDNLPA